MAASGILAGAARRASKKDHLKSSERVGECFGIVVVLLLTVFFLENQVQHTGFFTSRFGVTESLLFYGSALFGAVTMTARSLLGRRNAVRPLEVFGSLLWTLTSYCFLQVFPSMLSTFQISCQAL